MNLVEWLKLVMVSTGAEWVMWLMIILSIASVAIILERTWFFVSVRDDLARLSRELQNALNHSLDAAKKRMDQSPSAEAAVVSAGLSVAHFGPEAAEEAMDGAVAIQRMKLERRLAFLATLGNNAPFVGLFGTVIGVVMAFDALGQQTSGETAAAAQLAPQAVMSSIGEALVATAVGIAVAIPAVAANNLFQRMTRATLANTEALSGLLLIHLRGNPALSSGPAFDAEEPKHEEPRAEKRDEKKVKAKADDGHVSAKKTKAVETAKAEPKGGKDDEES